MERRANYHHGDVRNAAITAACEILSEGSSESIRLREVARRIGVNHSAIYQHFGGKTQFTVAIATRCYADLGENLRKARSRAGADEVKQLEVVCTEFIRYACRFPGRIDLLAPPHLLSGPLDDPDLRAAHDSVIQTLFDIIRGGQASGAFVAGEAGDLAFNIWAFCLGYWENCRTRRRFDGEVPVVDDGWKKIRVHFVRIFAIQLRSLMPHDILMPPSKRL